MTSKWPWSACAGFMLAVTLAGAMPARASDDPWAEGSNWLYVRGGYAKSTAEGAGNGGAGYGFGFRHMMSPSKVDKWNVLGFHPLGMLRWTLFKHFSLGGHVEYNVLGRFGSAEEIEVPAALELTDHILWKGAVKPYVSFGGGVFYRKAYATGEDFRDVSPGWFGAAGFDALVSRGHMLGMDVRMARVDNPYPLGNPVFVRVPHFREEAGHFVEVKPTSTHWSAKVSYSIAY